MSWPSALPLNNEHAQSTVACAILFPTLATLSVIGRFWSRHKQNASLQADDWIIIPALVSDPLMCSRANLVELTAIRPLFMHR